MPSASTSTAIATTRDLLSGIDTDLVVVPWFEDDTADAVSGLDKASGGELARALSAREFQAKPYEIFVTAAAERGRYPRRVSVIGGGRRTDSGGDMARKMAVTAGLWARQKRVPRLAFVLRGQGDLMDLAQAAAEGLTLPEFNGASY